MSKIDRRSFIKLGSAAVAGSMVTGCSASAPAAGGKIRFVTNHGEADGPLFKTVLDKFAAKYPDIQVDWLDIPGGDEFYTALNTQGAAGSLPDVFYTRTFDVPVFASKGWTLDLQSLVDRDAKEVNVDDFYPAQIGQMQFKGHLYALPYDFSNIAIYFNRICLMMRRCLTPPTLTGLGMIFWTLAENLLKRMALPSPPSPWICMFGTGFFMVICSVGAVKSGLMTLKPH